MDAYRSARLEDLDDLLALQRAYYAEDGYPFDPAAAREAFAQLLADPALGAAWIARARGGRALAYVVLTLGWSLEFGGRDGFVDELYVAPAARGRGLGRAGLAHAEAGARARGVRRLHLEVEDGKPGAHGLYRRSGFAAHGRTLMSKPLAHSDAPDAPRPHRPRTGVGEPPRPAQRAPRRALGALAAARRKLLKGRRFSLTRSGKESVRKR